MWDLQGDYAYDCLRIVLGFTYFMFLFELQQLLSRACDRVDADSYHDHHVNNDDHHVIIIIKDLSLNPLVLESIPVIDFNANDFKEGVECAVCLSELVDGDKARVLPSCNHQFHVDCIDTWFQLQSTCPLCRNKVDSVQLETRPKLA